MNFTVIKKDKNTLARVGVFKTKRGSIETPAYVIVGTHGKVKTLDSSDLSHTGTQAVISNTYHLWNDLGKDIESFGGLRKTIGSNILTMTDSGGFQVFSLGFGREHNVGKVGFFPEEKGEHIPNEDKFSEIKSFFKTRFGGTRNEKNRVVVSNQGVHFFDGEKKYLDPEISIGIQERLGADIILAFDECTSPFHSFSYTKKAMERTHKWAIRSLQAKKRTDQFLYGIVQGGAFKELRVASSKFIGDLPFSGYAIGGSLGNSRREMFQVIDWTMPYLPANKPVHLLGIGRIEDIFNAVERGIDTFDCVIPTREARHGSLWTAQGRFDITKGRYMNDGNSIEEGCTCPACFAGITKEKLYKLFKAKDMKAGYYATLHNVFFFNSLMEKIRNSIREDKFLEFKKEFLSYLNPSS